jgi:hypothetical protein
MPAHECRYFCQLFNVSVAGSNNIGFCWKYVRAGVDFLRILPWFVQKRARLGALFSSPGTCSRKDYRLTFSPRFAASMRALIAALIGAGTSIRRTVIAAPGLDSTVERNSIERWYSGALGLVGIHHSL